LDLSPQTTLKGADPAAVAAMRATLDQLVREFSPASDTRGVVGDLVLGVEAAARAAQQADLTRWLNSRSLAQILIDPTLADAAGVDDVLSNFGVARRSATLATGVIVVVVSAYNPVNIPAGAAFTAGVASFVVDQAIAVRIDPAQVTAAGDRALVAAENGRWQFTLPVTAAATGSTGLVRRNQTLTPGFGLAGFITAYAADDFTGGLDTESNADLVARLQTGMAVKAWSSRPSIEAAVRAEPEFLNLRHLSIIGAGQPEMLRDKHTIFPVAGFGRCDCYARFGPLPAVVQVAKTAVVTTVAGGVTTWQFSLGRDDAPGFYEVQTVRDAASSNTDTGFALGTLTPGYDLSGSGFVPDVANAAEAAFSRYSTLTVQFTTATVTTDAVGATRAVIADVSVMPLVAELQDFLAGPRFRDPAGDVLARAAVPCFVTLSVVVRKPALVASPDTGVAAAAAADFVNSLRFPGRIYAADVAEAIAATLPPGAHIASIELTGRTLSPDRQVARTHGNFVLEPAAATAVSTSPRTVAFFLDPRSVAIGVFPDGQPTDF
jgi:hypothetical protein